MTEFKLGQSAWRTLDRVLAEHNKRADSQGEHLSAHDEMNEIQNRRIDRLVERLDEAMARIAELEERK